VFKWNTKMGSSFVHTKMGSSFVLEYRRTPIPPRASPCTPSWEAPKDGAMFKWNFMFSSMVVYRRNHYVQLDGGVGRSFTFCSMAAHKRNRLSLSSSIAAHPAIRQGRGDTKIGF
jgi:hypothetical protein